MSNDLEAGHSRYATATAPTTAAGSAYRTRTGWSAEEPHDVTPSFDARVTSGYDPDAVGSYYPDPEDYPPMSHDADILSHSAQETSIPVRGWVVDPNPTTPPIPVRAGTTAGRATTGAPPLTPRPRTATSPQQPRRVNVSPLLLIATAIAVLGLIAAGLVSYQLITSPRADTSTAVTPTEQTPQDTPTDEQTPTTPAPEITAPAQPPPTLDTQPPTNTNDHRNDNGENDGEDDD